MSTFTAKLRTRLGDFELDVEFEASDAGVIGLFGASGSGKTTILRCLAGLHRADTGVVRFDGDVWQDDSTSRFVPAHDRPVGYVSQEDDQFPHLTVEGNLRYAEHRVPKEERTVAWDDVLEWLALSALLPRSVIELSGGERQRVALGRALLTSPRLLLLDEPVSSLDEPARREVLKHLEHVLRKLAIPVVYVSHSLTEVARLAKTVVWIQQGRVADAGPTSRVLARPDFSAWRDEEPAVVLEGVIREHDDQYHLTTVSTSLGNLTIHERPEEPGTAIKVQINARDVSIGLEPQTASSIVNELPLSIRDIVDLSPSDCLVRLSTNPDAQDLLLSRITRKSRAQLQLNAGASVFARVKSVAVLD